MKCSHVFIIFIKKLLPFPVFIFHRGYASHLAWFGKVCFLWEVTDKPTLTDLKNYLCTCWYDYLNCFLDSYVYLPITSLIVTFVFFILCNSFYLYPIGRKIPSSFTVCEIGKRKKSEWQTYICQILWHHGLRLQDYHILIFYSFGVWSNECKLFNKYVNHFL